MFNRNYIMPYDGYFGKSYESLTCRSDNVGRVK